MEMSWFSKNCSEDQISSTAKYRWANKEDEEEKRDKWGKKLKINIFCLFL